MVIEIGVTAKGDLIADKFNDTDCTLQEVSTALLRLKQIEQILIDKEFSSLVEADNNESKE